MGGGLPQSGARGGAAVFARADSDWRFGMAEGAFSRLARKLGMGKEEHKRSEQPKESTARKEPTEHKAAGHKTAEHKTAEHAEHAHHTVHEHVSHAGHAVHDHVSDAGHAVHDHVTHAGQSVHEHVQHAREVVAKHISGETHRYMVHFPPHPAREDDPHYKDFDAYHRKTRATARCYIGERVGFHDCRDEHGDPCPPPANGGEQPGLELHHSHVEFSLQNGVSLKALEKDYPGISSKDEVGAWVESEANFRWLCVYHHRGAGGAHTASHSDWEASQYVLGLISPEPDSKKNKASVPADA
jgi:hypothetical protein